MLFAISHRRFIGFGDALSDSASARSFSVPRQGALMHGQRFLHGVAVRSSQACAAASFGNAAEWAWRAGFFGFGVSATVS